MENKKNDIQIIEFSKYVKPDILPAMSTKWTLNGPQNEFYSYVKDCYEGSATNAAIINAFANYIYGEGLIDVNGQNIRKYISRKDLKLMVLDFKTYGGFGVQVIWNSALRPEDKKPLQLRYIPIFKLGLNIDQKTLETTGYWYSFDWKQHGKYKPVYYPKFDGRYKDSDVEISVVQRASSDAFFANPDYLSCLQHCEIEMEIANASINHIKNGFAGTKVVNIPFVPETEELKEEHQRIIKSKLTGSNNTNATIVSFNENPEHKITVDTIEVTELNQQYVHFSEKAEQTIIVGHSAPPILFASTTGGGGLGNNSEEIQTATKMLYRKHINPMREDIIDGLEEIMKFIDAEIELEFQDFEDFNEVDNTTAVDNTTETL